MPKELCWVPLSTHWCKMVLCCLNEMAKASTCLMRVVFVTVCAWAVFTIWGGLLWFFGCYGSSSYGMLADQVVHDVKAPIDNVD